MAPYITSMLSIYICKVTFLYEFISTTENLAHCALIYYTQRKLLIAIKIRYCDKHVSKLIGKTNADC